MAPFIGIGIFVILIVLDILGHRKLKVGRKFIDWFFLCLFAAFIALFALVGVRSALPAKASGTPGRYLAYRYLMDGDGKNARAVLLQDGSINEESAGFLNMLADAVEGDYRALYFASEQFSADPSSMPAQKGVALTLNDLAVAALEGNKTSDFSAEEIAAESFAVSDITETAELRDYYDLDRLVRTGNAADVDPELIRALPASFPEEESVKKLVISYYVQEKDFGSALAAAGELLDENDSAANRIIYTDVLAEEAYSLTEESIRESEDKEALSLLAKSDQAAEKASKAEFGSEQYAKQTESARSTLDEIPKLSYQRILNYINAKKPFSGDSTGLYDLQLIKMDLLKGSSETAFERTQKLLAGTDELKDTSPVKADLAALAEDVETFYSTGEDEDRDRIFEDCERLMLSQCEGVVMMGEDNINIHAARLLASEFVYGRTIFEITGIDASAFPKVSAAVHTNVRKGNIFGGAGEFYKDDFRISENGEDFSDFSLAAGMGAGDRSLVIAADTGGGDPELMASLYEALKPVENSSMAKKRALIDGNAVPVCSFTDSTDYYLTAVRDLVPEGEASSYEMITASLALLENEKTTDREILLISDGFDLTADQAVEISRILREEGVILYILNISGMNEDTAESASESSGGLHFGLSLREELGPAVALVKDLMSNSYLFTYKTTDDITGAHTVTITLTEPYAQDSEGYLQEVNG